MEIRLLGPVLVSRGGVPVPLPRSRKVRALLAYLALSRAPVSRARLCSLLWDVPNDPRGELRWCLSKLRGILDEDKRQRVVSEQSRVALDLSDCVVDALELERAAQGGIELLSDEQLAALRESFGGELLAAEALEGNAEFAAWLAAQRQRYRALQVAGLSELTARATAPEEAFDHIEAWLRLAPFDQRAHERMLERLVSCGRARDAEQHLAATIRAYERDGLDWAPLRSAFHALRAASREPARVPAESAAEGWRHHPLRPITHATELAPAASASSPEHPPRRRASVAVMPFVDASAPLADGRALVEGLSEDVLTRLAKLRVLFVIARGSVYALSERGITRDEAARILNVDYIVSGSLRRRDARIAVFVELVETQTARIVWADEIEAEAGDAFSVLDTIVDRIVATIAEEIAAAECQRAILKPPNSLDAWEAFHRGLWHMYKFNASDNQQAGQFFQQSLKLDPMFSRAYAGLSFTHFQNAFLDLTPNRQREIERALETAGQSLSADGRDPAAHWAMGRALWLRGAHAESVAELEHSVELSPNFALGHYTLGFVQSQAGDPRAAILSTDISRELSPFDPLQFAMLASRALAHVRLGELEQAAHWALKATGRPHAHVHILAIAAECLSLSGRDEEARRLVANVRARVPNYSVADLLRSFHFAPDTAALFRKAARRIGFDSSS